MLSGGYHRDPVPFLAVIAFTSKVIDRLAGHVRFGATRGTEFAAGWNETVLSKEAVSKAMTPHPTSSRGWLHAYATPNGPEALEFRACTCGVPRRVQELRDLLRSTPQLRRPSALARFSRRQERKT
jgi:hypothetical protein